MSEEKECKIEFGSPEQQAEFIRRQLDEPGVQPLEAYLDPDRKVIVLTLPDKG